MSYDPRFDEATAEVDKPRQWNPKDDASLPNPLTIIADEWVEITTDYGPTDILIGRDREGRRWSKLVGSALLKKSLIDGIVEEWSEKENAFVEKEVLGKVKPGEVVAIFYGGEKQGAKFTYSLYEVSRKPERDEETVPADAAAANDDDDGVPF